MEKEDKLTRFSDMSSEQKEGYMTYFNNIMVTQAGWSLPKKEYDSDGLRFDIDYLNSVKQNVVVLPLEMMADYCDVITKGIIDDDINEEINKYFLNDVNIKECYEALNATAIGNMAYCGLWCKNLKARALAVKQLNEVLALAKIPILAAIKKGLE